MRLEEEIKQQKFKSEYQKAAINILFTHNWLQHTYARELKKYNLTVQQYNVLRILRGQHSKPASIKLVKERMLDKMSDASRIVEKLRIKGLLERNECPKDRRNVDVLITAKGLALLSSLDFLDEHFKEKFKSLDKKEIALLNNLLDKIREE
jgi:DNA-binding MarR family transcriptional regulator